MSECDIGGCRRPHMSGTHWGGMYVLLCEMHFYQSQMQPPRPDLKQSARAREALRNDSGRLPADWQSQGEAAS